ncbi:MAG: OmpA family protein, partial [Christensenellaceae bacterium]|nr:OmpA family protein [Christensenellaceae bacterium]
AEKENALIIAQQDLSTREQQLVAANTKLKTQKDEMAIQQQKIDDLIGVRTEIIRDLSTVFSAQNLKASVDTKTGDIVLESAVFFETAKSNIRTEGEELLNKFLPIYLSVLLRDEYKDYLGEISIEGHTDTAGDYIMNLELSQNRALSVAKYCLSLPSINENQRTYLRELLTAKGKSFSSPILNEDGSVNMDKSRRVEFKFRLKDSEMIVELNNILKQN